jgi:hypothetical protein
LGVKRNGVKLPKKNNLRNFAPLLFHAAWNNSYTMSGSTVCCLPDHLPPPTDDR